MPSDYYHHLGVHPVTSVTSGAGEQQPQSFVYLHADQKHSGPWQNSASVTAPLHPGSRLRPQRP
ncbi:hypothetical protein CRUP_031191 [Coryphaenoides rupestris]|nr:hypothetical protein CRUP_031191 [Coryphaenoides rupestris]